MNKDRQYRLANEDVKKLLIEFSIPSIVGMLVNALYNIVDRIFIGNIPEVGKLAITGVGLTLPITTIIMAFGMLIGVGSAANISIQLGKKKKDGAENILGNAFTMLILIGLFITIFGNAFAKPILNSLGASQQTLGYAMEYVRIILFGTVFNIIAFGMNNLIRAEGNPKISMYTMLLGAILNTILDPIFIFTFNMGIKGGAIATVIAQFASATWVLIYYFKGNSFLKIKKENLKVKIGILKRICAIGMAPFSMQLAASVVSIISNRALKTHGGDLAIGAMTAIGSIVMIFLMPIFGINQGAQPIVGFNYGANSIKRVKQTLKYAIIAATTICIIGFLSVEIFPDKIIKLFNDDTELVDIGVKGIRIYLAMLPLIGFQIVSSNFFQAIGRAKISMVLSMTRQVIFLIPLMIILPRIFGLNGVWFAGATSDLLATIVTFIFIVREMKILNLKEKQTS